VNRALVAQRGALDPQSVNNRIEMALDTDTIDRAIDGARLGTMAPQHFR
jgi:hypothetical protein